MNTLDKVNMHQIHKVDIGSGSKQVCSLLLNLPMFKVGASLTYQCWYTCCSGESGVEVKYILAMPM